MRPHRAENPLAGAQIVGVDGEVRPSLVWISKARHETDWDQSSSSFLPVRVPTGRPIENMAGTC